MCIEEFCTINVQEIVNEWLAKAGKRIGTEPVLPDVPPRRSAVGTEDKSKTDGTVYFDFRTEIPLPNASQTSPLLVIDMELQNEYKKRLALHKRSVYYNCRIISLKNSGFDDNTICSMLGITLQKLRQFNKRLSGEADLTPKTV